MLFAGPCYRCLFPEAPGPQSCSSCSDAGVLGVVPGIIGSLQVLHATCTDANKSALILASIGCHCLVCILRNALGWLVFWRLNPAVTYTAHLLSQHAHLLLVRLSSPK